MTRGRFCGRSALWSIRLHATWGISSGSIGPCRNCSSSAIFLTIRVMACLSSNPATARIVDINGRACINLGYSRDELLGMKVTDVEVAIPSKTAWNSHVKEVKKAGAMLLEGEERRKDGSTFPVEASIKYISREGSHYMVWIVRDITERKRAEEKLSLFRALLDNSSDGVEVLDPDTYRFLDLNDAECRMLGYSREEMLSMSVFDIDPLFDDAAAAAFGKALRETGKAQFEGEHRRRDGSTFPVEASTTRIDLDKPYLLTIARDITERKNAEAILGRTNRALKTLSDGNLALVQATDEDELLRDVTRIIVQQAGYAQAVVDYVDDDLEKSITPKAWSGYEGERYWAEHLSWADTEQGQLPVSKAIRTGKTQVCPDIAADPAFEPWREHVMARGYASNIALPMAEGGRTFGVLSIYGSAANEFDDEEISLLEELANDLAYGIVALRTRKSNEQHALILQQSLEQSIQTIAATVEARDPYTAGHQQRVGKLATAIARELGLPDEQINGIHLAAIIHDLGKIQVPAEILSKPGKITDIEYQLIKQHPQAGYDILKDVKFPWPIADIVLQHHERLDGSGYPQGLKGDAILLEARIIAVADVVEAMSSHRPYRPGLGIDIALDEIIRMRGTYFDPQVVDACVALFREKGYVIPD